MSRQGNNYQPQKQVGMGDYGPPYQNKPGPHLRQGMEMQPTMNKNMGQNYVDRQRGLLDEPAQYKIQDQQRRQQRGNQDLWLLYLLLKAGSFLCYFFLPMVFPKVLTYIVVLALCAMDFWLTQNIIGRKLVKLRWWYMIDDSTGGEEVWLFESKDLFQDKLVFWFTLYVHPLVWIMVCILNIITFSMFETIVAFVCALIAFINLYGFRQCQNDHGKRMRQYMYQSSKQYMEGLVDKQRDPNDYQQQMQPGPMHQPQYQQQNNQQNNQYHR